MWSGSTDTDDLIEWYSDMAVINTLHPENKAHLLRSLRGAFEGIRASEREACAKVANAHAEAFVVTSDVGRAMKEFGHHIAVAIRRRSETNN